MSVFLNADAIQLQSRVLTYRDELTQMLVNTPGCLQRFYDIVKKVATLPVVVDGKSYDLPDVDVTCDHQEGNDTPVCLSIDAHKGVTEHKYPISIRVCINSSTFGQQLYRALYSYLARLSQCLVAHFNAEKLSTLTRDLIETPRIAFHIGSTIKGVTDTSISLGIAQERLMQLNSLLSTINISEGIRETFSDLPCVLEAKKRRTEFALKLGLYTMQSPKTLLKKAYPREASAMRNGVGIHEHEGLVSLIDCRVCTTEEAQRLKQRFGNACTFVRNTQPRAGEYIKAKSMSELDDVQARLLAKGVSFEVLPNSSENMYKVLIKQNICYIRVFGPINLETYTNTGVATTLDLFSY